MIGAMVMVSGRYVWRTWSARAGRKSAGTKKVGRPSWMVIADCSTYDVGCVSLRREEYAAYPLEDRSHGPIVPGRVEAGVGEALERRVAREAFSSGRAQWWRSVTSSTEAAISAASARSQAAGARAASVLRSRRSLESQLSDLTWRGVAALDDVERSLRGGDA